jgi:tetratricopeptide (TPR) repeat protein
VLEGQGHAQDVKDGLRLADEALAHPQDNPVTLALSAWALATLGYRVMGMTVMGFRHDEAEREIERALSLSDNLAAVTHAAGIVRLCVGDGDAAIAHLTRTMRLSPLDPSTGAFLASAAYAHIVCGRYEEALVTADRAIQASPLFSGSHRARTLALAFLGRIDEARTAAAQLRALAPLGTVSRSLRFMPFKDARIRRSWARMLLASGVPR